MYLHVTSNHPNSVKNAIPYGLGIRAKRICSEAKDYELRREEITEHLQKRGYSRNTVENQLSKVDSLDRTSLLKYNTRKQNTDRVPLVVTYSYGLPNIHNILSKNLKILHQSERMKEVFKNVPLVSYKRDKNIKDIFSTPETQFTVL